MFDIKNGLFIDTYGFEYDGDITVAGVASIVPEIGELSLSYHEAEARRNPTDEYDAAKGRKVALTRLLEQIGATKEYRTKVWAAYHKYVREAESFLGLNTSNK